MIEGVVVEGVNVGVDDVGVGVDADVNADCVADVWCPNQMFEKKEGVVSHTRSFHKVEVEILEVHAGLG
jgi:hypothetical protein